MVEGGGREKRYIASADDRDKGRESGVRKEGNTSKRTNKGRGRGGGGCGADTSLNQRSPFAFQLFYFCQLSSPSLISFL
jgi:hypothetical protein